MPKEVQFRRGDTNQNNNFKGAEGELSVNLDTYSIRVHNGITTGGYELARNDLSNVSGISTTNIDIPGNISATTLNSINGNFTGIVTSPSFIGNLTGIASTSIDVIGGIGSLSSLNVSGITTTELLQVGTGGTIITTTPSGLVGIGTLTPTSKLTVEGDGYFSGNLTASSFTGVVVGVVTTAEKLENTRTFEITGDIVASPQNFNGTQNVSLASSIQPNTVGLGTHTYGDYVKNITGTIGEIEVNLTSGEGVSPQIGLPNDVVISNNLTVSNDLQVSHDLNVNGNITVGGTTAYLIVDNFIVKDRDIVTGFTTDAYGNETSNDITANTGGIAVASTEGSPLVNLTIAGIETLPPTYKKLMWFKENSFAGLNTDAWLFNYGVGIGSTQIPNGVRLAVGDVKITEFDISKVRNVNASGIITGNTFRPSSGFIQAPDGTNSFYIYSGTGNVAFQGTIGASQINNASGYKVIGFAGTNITFENNVYASGITTSIGGFVGNLTGTATTSVNVIGGIGSLTSLNVSGFSTLGNLSSGNINSTGIITATQLSLGNGNIGINTNTIYGPAVMFIDPAGVGDNSGSLRIKGDLYVDGTQTIINSTILNVSDLKIGVAATTSNDIALDGAGIGIGSTSIQKTFTWQYSTSSLKSSENINLASGKSYKINDLDVLSSNTLGSGVVNSSLTSVGTLNQLNVSGATTSNSLSIGPTQVISSSRQLQNINSLDILTTATIKDAVSTNPNTFTNLQVAGFSTFLNGPVLVGTSNTTGTATQRLQVTGGAYVSGNLGIGTTNPTSKLQVNGDINLDDGGTFTTTIQTITPTANRTVSVPDATGTLALVAGSANQIVYNNAGANAGASGFTYNNASQTLTVSAASTTTSSPILNLSQTWNSSGTTFSGFTLNITDTASAAGSLLGDWQINGSSRFQLLKSGLGYYYNTSTSVTNWERAKIGWESNIFRIGTEKLGTGVERNLELQTDGTTRLSIGATTGNVGINTTVSLQPLQVNPIGTNVVVIDSMGELGIGTTNPTVKLQVIGDASISGVITATTFSGNLNSSGVNTATTLSGTTVSYNTGNFTNGNIVTGVVTSISGTNLNYSGIATVGSLSIGSTQVISSARQLQNIVSLDATTTATIENAISNAPNNFSDLQVTGLSTFTNGPVLIGSGTSTGTASQPLQVTGGSYISGNLGIGTTNPTVKLQVIGDASISGVITASSFSGNASSATYSNTSGISTVSQGLTGTPNIVVGIATASSFVGNLTGTATTATNLSDAANITTGTINSARLSGTYSININGSSNYATSSGVSTNVIGGIASVTSLNVTGVATVSSNLTVNGNTLYVDAANNRVGILTISPLQPLQVGSGSSVVTIDSLGELGIGTTNPTVKLQVIGDASISGVITASSFSGNLNSSGVNTATTLSGTTVSYNTGNFTNGNIVTGIVTTISGSNLNYTGVGTITTLNSTNTTLTNLSVSGVSTFTNGPVLIGSGTSTGTATQRLQVTGGAYVSGNLGIGTTNPTRRVQILGDSSTNQFNTALSIMNTNASGFGAYVGLNATSITSGRDWRLVSAGTSESAGVGNFSIYDGTALVDRFVINSSGNIGIRTTNPIQPIHFGSRADLVTVGILTNVTVGVTTTIISGITTTGLRTGYELLPVTNIIASGTTITGIGSTSINLGSSTLNGTQQTGVTLTFAARNDGNVVVVTGIGSVGIGTTNPTSKLHLNGDINLDDGGTFTTTIQCITPTANRTVSVPDSTGTLALVAGSNNQVTYNSSGANAGATGLIYNPGPQTLTVGGALTTTSSPILNLSQTWNAGAITFSGVTLNITDTASAALSLLQDWQVGGASRYQFVKSGLSYYYNTSTSVTNYERAKIGWESNILRFGTEKLGTGTARGLELQTDGTTRLSITSTGNIGIQTTVPLQSFQVNPIGSSVVVIDSSGRLGIGTTTPSRTLDVVGNANISGISTVGLGSTSSPTVNSTMSFELTNDTTLTVRVRGSDGVVRTGTISLA